MIAVVKAIGVKVVMNNAKLMVIQIVTIWRLVADPQVALWNSNIVAMMPYLELTIILLSNVYTDSCFDVSSFSWTFWFILGLHPRIHRQRPERSVCSVP